MDNYPYDAVDYSTYYLTLKASDLSITNVTGTNPPVIFSIRANDGLIVAFHPSGRVELGEKYKDCPDRAAKVFLQALVEQFPDLVRSIRENKS